MEALLPFVLGSGISALGNYFGAQTAAAAQKQAAQLQQQRFDQASSYATPFITGGQNSFNQYNNATGANGPQAQASFYNNFQNSPGYQDAVNYGQGQINAQAAAQGQNLSGNTLAALRTYDTGQQLQAYQQNLSNLYAGSQLGANQSSSLINASTASANNQGNFTAAAGQQLGAGLSVAGNAPNNALINYYYGTKANPNASTALAS